MIDSFIMEDVFWQRKHINENKDALLEATNCNSRLIEQLELTMPGITDKLKRATLIQNGILAEPFHIYEIALSEPNGYAKLANALWVKRQTGALGILLKGLLTHTDCNPLTLCGININYNVFLASAIEFKGRISEHKLSGIFGEELKVTDLEKMFNNICSDDSLKPKLGYDYIDTFITKEKSYAIWEDTIPADTPKATLYYATSFKLDKQIFQKQCCDLFVFKNLGPQRIGNLTDSNNVTTSGKKIDSFSKKARFISLDKFDDWCELTQQYSQAMHLIKTEKSEVTGDTFFLEETSGVSAVLGNFISLDNGDSLEHKIIENITPKNAIFRISTTERVQGQWFLANLARRIQWKWKEKVVLYISIAKFIKYFEEKRSPDILHSNEALKFVINYVTRNSIISKVLFNELMNRRDLKFALFFDGFERVREKNLEWAINILKCLNSNESVENLFVTSSPPLNFGQLLELKFPVFQTLSFHGDKGLCCIVRPWSAQTANNQQSKYYSCSK